MTAAEILKQFFVDIRETGVLEYIAVAAGIASVWYSRKEHLLVYPVGLISTTIYIYLSSKNGLLGEASVNFYYTVMSFYGWWRWTKKNNQHQPVLHITSSGIKEWCIHLIFFAVCFIVIFFSLTYLKRNFAPEAIPWADAFASGTAFTGMWLMTKKKVESWYWWMATNIASIPLYFVKHYVLSSIFYLVLLVMAVAGLVEWRKRENNVINKIAHGPAQ